MSPPRTPREPHTPSLAVNRYPCEIRFQNLGFTIGNSGDGGLAILKDVTGVCAAKRMVAVMGPSGAGKSTLLKILACNVAGGEVKGQILVNGALVHPKVFKNQSAVVWQSDVLLASATVKEALMTSALLKLPQSLSRARKEERVEQILEELELQGVKNHLIGEDVDGAVSGISGGERRRVSVGIGLVTDARAIFLDEPTTGLDSDSAEQLISLLSHLATHKHRTIVLTIHQPSSDICERFDDLILLSSGRMLYCGPWADADQYFASAGFERPGYRSTAEHILTLCKDKEYAVPFLAGQYAKSLIDQQLTRLDSQASMGGIGLGLKRGGSVGRLSRHNSITGATEAGKALARGGSLVIDLEAQAVSSPQPGSAPAAISSAAITRHMVAGALQSVPSNGLLPDDVPSTSHANIPEEVATSQWYQVHVLSVRFLRSWYRCPTNLAIQAAQYIFFAGLIGATYWRLSPELPGGTFDRLASLWFVASCMVLQPGNNACTIMYSQKPLLRREISNGLYHYSSFFIAKSLTSLPFQLAFACIFTGAVYFLVGYQVTVVKFFMFFALNFELLLISETLGILCAGLARNELVGMIILATFYVPLLMFTGFIQTHTPVYLAWIKKLSYVAYGYSGLVKNEFEGLSIRTAQGMSVPDATGLIPANIENGLSIGTDALIMLGILIGMRFIAYLHMTISIKHHWL
ncbi:ABC transporter G family member 19 [Coccomyxa sp. Obi]|nr:ABC transporter G family member 19 [Coccomyxa sp. Obi]